MAGRHKLPKELKKVRIGVTMRVRPYEKEYILNMAKVDLNQMFKDMISNVLGNEYQEWLKSQDVIKLIETNGIDQ